jgi:hypothetical protein
VDLGEVESKMALRVRRGSRVTHRTLRFRKLVHAPLAFVYRWCTDYREDDDRITDDIYHYQAKIALREPDRIVRVITVPGGHPNRDTDVELIFLLPPDRWHLKKFSLSDDKTGSYHLTKVGPDLTSIEMVFRETWKVSHVPDRERYRTLFNGVWDRYVEVMEKAYRRQAR